jgi:DNA-binding response OmpR family regulator
MASKVIHVLLAEDDPFLSKIIKNRLREEGFDVVHAPNGKEAMEHLGKTKFDIALLDLIMPLADGFEVLKFIKTKKLKLPALVFSNLAQKEDKEEALRLGAKDYFVKSDIAIDELVATVKKWI